MPARDVPPEVELESVDCPLCGPAEDTVVFEGSDRLHDLPGRFTIVRCLGCGLMRTNPRPTPETIGYYYPPEYGPHLYTRVAPAPHDGGRRRWRQSVRRLLDSQSLALPRIEPGRLLEVGCASGSFLAAMRERGWKAEGIEFSPVASAAAREAGFDVHTGAVESAPLPDERFDLIAGWMVLEHLHDPLAALAKLRRAIRPDGWLALSVPNAASVDFRLFKDAGYAVQLPAHLFHFTPASLALVLERGGWKVDRLRHQRSLANLAGSAGNRLCERFPSSRAGAFLRSFPERGGRAADLLFPLAWLLGAMGQSGRMTVWARPR
jgi:SAM-dependent methyltransferase